MSDAHHNCSAATREVDTFHSDKCPTCLGDGYIGQHANSPDVKCPNCSGTGFVDTGPNVELLIENLVQAAAEYENNCDRLVAKTIRVQLEKAKQAIRDAITTQPQTLPLTPGKSDMLELSKHIETGLMAYGSFFAPPLSRRQWWMIASSLDYAARFDVQQSAATGEEFLPRDAWNELVHKDDRTSPEEYPDMCLISFDELKDYMERHTPPLSRPNSESGK